MSLTTDVLLGGLTTTWTPPSACLETQTFNEQGLWAPAVTGFSGSSSLSPAVFRGATGLAPDLVCYPPQYTMNHVFSPGICPSGWTSACSPSASGNKQMLPEPTTAVQCCPSGMTCSDFSWCKGQPESTMGPHWSIYTDKWGIEGVMTTTNFQSHNHVAKPIIVAYESSDQAVFAAAAESASSSLSTVTITASSGGGSSDSSSLSGGAIAGIAIASMLGGLLLATTITFFALRFCLGYRKISNEEGASSSSSVHEHQARPPPNYYPVNELQSQNRAFEMPSFQDKIAGGVPELPATVKG